ncbi:MAG: PEP-utilizing enzyme [Acidimicrobiia bacterium]|nr:PEP-utilizing enzyme [Acidimicrobiia bacterium]
MLARRAAEAFGAPQDVEWAVAGGELFLLQSRPVTAAGPAGTPSGPVLGPGPVAETFPAPLAALEEDLWVEPLRRALGEVLLLTGAASRRRVEASPIVRTVAGRVAADLELLGLEERTGRRRWLARLDPRPPARRLRAAWRVGRLRVALPGLGRDLVREVDRQLAEVPRPRELDLATLRRVLGRCREALVAVHGHEVLAGRLLDDGEASATAASAALRVLAEHAGAGTPDEELVARFPVLLALVPPAVGRPVTLPPAPAGLPAAATSGEDAGLREALRLRARWLHELSARVALEIGRRLAAANRLPEPASVRHLTLDRLDALLAGRVAVDLAGGPGETEAPLPARFRLTDAGAVLPLADGPGDRAGRGAGGGRGSGTVRGLGDLPAGGSVLVVGTLDPDLAPHLPGLAGLVAETGSPLSHLAILARELGVPVAVGVRGARDRFPPGTRVVVDGTTGEVIVAPEEAPVP